MAATLKRQDFRTDQELTVAFFASARRTMQDDVADLTAELSRLAKRASSLASDAGGDAGGWLRQNAPSYDDVRDAAGSGASVLWRGAGRAMEGAEEHIRHRPAAAALALVGIGVLLGLMAKR